ncbi:hypothetical protein WAK64_18625 [Bacillus spongiae]|uniref:Sporulation protein n=1 Tax=Bacillus spongiae TaxID=2683610 RepID=A0ABU8HI45_9BACI
MWKWSLFIASALFINGCGMANDSTYSNVEDEDGHQFMTENIANNDTEARSPTDQNPNLLNLSEKQPNTGSEIDKAREVVELYTEYEPGSVWINGQQMWVTVHTNKRLSTSKKESQEAKLHKQLETALPSYNINVKIEEK